MAEMRNACKTLVGKPEGKRPLEDMGLYRRIILIDLSEIGGKLWSGCIWLRIRTSGLLL
jgi:hypothetical protein